MTRLFGLILPAALCLTACDLGSWVGSSSGIDSEWDTGWYPGLNDSPSSAVACLSADATPPQAWVDAGVFTIEGTLEREAAFQSDRAVVGCSGAPMESFAVTDARGTTWVVGYAWLDGRDNNITPQTEQGWGDTVRVTFRHDPATGASGFVVRDVHGIALALDNGADGGGLVSEDLPGLQHRVGGVVGHNSGDCGERDILSQVFVTDTERVSLYPGEDGTLTLPEGQITACSITAWQEAGEGTCGDSPGTVSSYMLFR